MKNKEIEEFDKKQLEELLKRLKDINNFTGFKNGAFKYYLGKYEADLLLSYIEQLEKDKEILIRNNNIGNERLKELQNINKQLQNDKLKRCFNTQKRRRKEEAQKKKLYKSRIDKAIEYIEKNTDKLKNIIVPKIDFDYKELLNKLKGDSDE